MDIAEIRGKDDRELRLDMQAMSKELFEMRFKATAEGVGKPHRFKEIRRNIARIKTVLRQRALTAPQSDAGASEITAPATQS